MKKENQQGFSLLELVVAMGVIAILCAICIPALQGPTRDMHRFSAELKLLAWQVNGLRPNDDRYYHYQQITDFGETQKLAISTLTSDTCSELILSEDSKKPNSCWPTTT